MKVVSSKVAWVALIVLAALAVSSAPHAQAGGTAGAPAAPAAEAPALPRIVPVRVVRDFELGTNLEQFAGFANVLLERRELPVPDLSWSIGQRGSLTATAIILTEALAGTDRRIGARLDYRTVAENGSVEEHSSILIDYDEVLQVENVLAIVIRALTQGNPGEREILAYDYVTKGGFRVNFTATRGPAGPIVRAVVGPAIENSKEGALKIMDDCRIMFHGLVQNLASK